MDFRRTHQAFREQWEKTDDKICKNSMSLNLHNTLRQDFFASYLYLLEQIPLGRWQVSQINTVVLKLLKSRNGSLERLKMSE